VIAGFLHEQPAKVKMKSNPGNRPFATRVWRLLLRSGFHLLYNEFAWTYDGVSWLVSLGQWRDWQRTGLPFLIGEDVLELAHGPGHMQVELEAAGFRPVGIDLSPFMSRLAKNNLRKAGVKANLIRSRAQTLPFPDKSFDSILATFPTEFIVDPAAVSEGYRTLRSGGNVVVVAEAQLSGGGIIRNIIEWLYFITGQRQVLQDEKKGASFWLRSRQVYLDAGFDVRVERIRLEGSLVTVAIARKDDLPRRLP
jgi:ubiquinone/menaquinone biosynthesis C-methylase UbiE